jgi:type IV secretion system protein VirB10
MLGFGLVMIYVVYSMLQPSDEEVAMQKKSEINTSQPITTPIADVGQNVIVPEIPKLPDVPTLSAPIPPPAATPTPPPVMDIVVPNVATPALPTVPAAPTQVMTPLVPSMVVAPPSSDAGIIGVGRSGPTAEEQAEAARKRAKITSSIMLKSGSGSTASQSVNSEGKALNVLVRNTDQVVATHVGEQQRLIMQGKIIDAVLETAINTDLPGSLRAVVSRDVYSETGKNILINRGSRLVGTYSSTVAYGVARVQILWERIIRPDGVDIKIASGGVDNLGRSGTPGEVDNHIMQNLSSAMMISTLDIALATYFDKNSSSSSSTTTTVTPGVSTTGEASTTGAVVTPTVTSGETPTNAEDSSKEALSKIQEIGKQILAKSMARPPTVTVNQGASLKVYVKKDLLFPGSSANLTRVIE